MKNNELFFLLGRIYANSIQENQLLEKYISIENHDLNDEDINELVLNLKLHKVFEIAKVNIEFSHMIYSEDKFLNKVKEVFLGVDVKNVEEKEIKKILNKYDLNEKKILFIKGSAIGKYYPEKYNRNTADIDLIIRDLDYFVKVLEKLGKDFEYNRLKIYINNKKEFTGSIDLEPRDTNSNLVPIDIHLLNYFIWGGIDFPEKIWDDVQIKDSVLIPSINSMVVMLVAHFSNQWKYRMRDVNDLYIMMNNPEIDWKEVNLLAEELNLKNMLIGLLMEVKKVYDLSDLGFVCEDYKLPVSSKIFFKNNFGIPKVITSCPAEYIFSYQNYRSFFSVLRSANHSLYNTFNHLVFKNRAFFVNNKSKIRKWKPNRILILKKSEQRPMNDIEKVKLSKKCFILNKGKKDEQFIFGDDVWVQSSYY